MYRYLLVVHTSGETHVYNGGWLAGLGVGRGGRAYGADDDVAEDAGADISACAATCGTHGLRGDIGARTQQGLAQQHVVVWSAAVLGCFGGEQRAKGRVQPAQIQQIVSVQVCGEGGGDGGDIEEG